MLKKAFILTILLAIATFQRASAQQQVARTGSFTASDTNKTVRVSRAPVRRLEDPHSSFSAVALDVARDEIVLSDENLAQILVYNRLDNTPPQAALTEPKRIIGGPLTRINLNCGTYVDPFSGDIYSVNGDTENWMTVWTREQKGNVPASRVLAAPHRAFGVAVNEEAKELYLSIEHPPAIVVYPKLAKGNDVPLRILEGDKTLLADVHGIALDTKNQLMYVINQGATTQSKENMYWTHDVKPDAKEVEWTESGEQWRGTIPGSGKFSLPSITVYPLKAKGDTAPIRIIQGPLTRLDWPTHMSLDVEHGDLFVINSVTDEVAVFHTNDNGNVAPYRTIKGSHTGLKTPHGVFADVKNNELVVANFGNHSATTYRLNASGDAAPVRTIRAALPNTPAPMFGNIAALAYDTKRDQIMVPNWVAFPQIAGFARLANGDAAPVRRIAGQSTLISRADHDLEYDSVNDEFIVGNPEGGAILVFRGGASGEEPPVRVIQGPHTQINDPGYGTFSDPVHNELYVCEKEYILVFPRTAKGDVPPLRVIKGPNTLLKNARGIQVDPVRNIIFAATNNGMLLFNRTDNGDVAPRAAIKGPMSGIRTTIQNFRLSPKGYVVASLGGGGRRGDEGDANAAAEEARGGGRGGVRGIVAWSMDEMAAAHGTADIAPAFILSNPKGRTEGQRIAVNPKAKEVMIGGERAVEVYSFPEIF